MMVISDDAGASRIAGLMGGEAFGLPEATTEVLLESAYWDPITIAATGRALKIIPTPATASSAVSTRSSRCPGSSRHPAMMIELCGGAALGKRRGGKKISASAMTA